MLSQAHPILRINYAKPRPHSLSAAQQLPSSCSITAEKFSEINYVQLQQSNSQNPSCSSTPIQFISCSAAASSCSITAEQFSESIMYNHAHTVYQLLSSCTAE